MQGLLIFYGGHSVEFIIHSPKHGNYTVLIDDEDVDKIKNINWCICIKGELRKKVYVKKVRSNIYMHRFLMNEPNSIVDHINGNTLDNRKLNLRICTHAENMRNVSKKTKNTSGYKGVFWEKGKWKVQLKYNYKSIHLGRFNNKIDAALAYNQAAIKYYGEFAQLNKVSYGS
jgi:hypothetical protein